MAENRTLKGNARGSTIVEFAVMFTILLTLFFGIIDFGRAVYSYHFVANAAREGTRWASVRGSLCNTWAGCSSIAATDVDTYVRTLDRAGIYINPAAANTDPGYLGITTTWNGKKVDGTDCTVGSTKPSPSHDPGCVVQVVVHYNFGFTLPLLSQANVIDVRSTSKFVISQ